MLWMWLRHLLDSSCKERGLVMNFRRKVDTYDLEDIEIYTLVLNGALRAYPNGFWDGVDGKVKARKIFKYVIEYLLCWSLEDLKQKAKMPIVDEYKLQSMISNVFNGSIFIAIGETYPELKEWADRSYKEQDEHDNTRYTDEQLIHILLEKAKDLGRTPKGVDMTDPSGSVFSRRFGSWEKGLMKAGFIEDIYADVDFEQNTKEKVIKNLKRLFAENERVLDKEEILKIYPEGLIKEYFGNYLKLEKTVIEEYNKEELVNILKKKKDKLGRNPFGKDMNFPKAIVFIDKFGSWDKAIAEMEKG